MKGVRDTVITIDGPAGAGKSTVAGKLAMRLGLIHLNSGALYRAVALKAIQSGVSLQDKASLQELAKSLDFKFFVVEKNTRLRVNGEDLQEQLSLPEISSAASSIATIVELREILNVVQRNAAEDNPLVLEGRDAGTVVFPDAEAKFYLIADVEERARRRHQELLARGINVDLATIRSEIIERDNRDETREVAPQKPAQDSVLIDTSGKSIEAVVEEIISNLRAKGIEPKGE